MKESTILKFLQKELSKISKLNRKSKILLQIITDVIIAFSCFPLALFLGNLNLHDAMVPEIYLGSLISIICLIIAFVTFGLYQSLVRFITGNIIIIITKSVLIASCIFAFFIFFAGINIPFTIPFIYALVTLLSTGGIRFLIRRLFLNTFQKIKKPAIIYGAGEAGRELQSLLLYNHEIQPVAFLDDDPSIQGLNIGGCNVYSSASFTKVSKEYDVKLILLALPNISRQRRREIIEKFQSYKIEIKSIPTLSKILTGQALVSDLRPVTPEMLLGRDPIDPNEKLMQQNISNKSVMVTGAGGSIGSEICLQALTQNPTKLILYELSELALYQINQDLVQMKEKMDSTTTIVPILGSTLDEKRVSETITAFEVNSIYHAAAYKHVPLIEDNVIEGINNNVFGTLKIAEIAVRLEVDSFTLISTDKAVRPTNIMGASKRVAELICQAYASQLRKTKFSMVRFGNVLGSSGSVIPLFQKQIEAGGPVTVTHPEITRYFMTIREAAQLVIQASAMTEGGDVFVLDMGKPVKITKLAEDMIKLAGMLPCFLGNSEQGPTEPGKIPIHFTGLRSGEKLYEELLISNNPEQTEHARIMKATEVSLPMTELEHQLNRLNDACSINNLEMIMSILKELPIDFSHNITKPINPKPLDDETEIILFDQNSHKVIDLMS